MRLNSCGFSVKQVPGKNERQVHREIKLFVQEFGRKPDKVEEAVIRVQAQSYKQPSFFHGGPVRPQPGGATAFSTKSKKGGSYNV